MTVTDLRADIALGEADFRDLAAIVRTETGIALAEGDEVISMSLVDGGKGQVASAQAAVDELVGLPRLAVVGEVRADDALEVHPQVAVVVLVHVARGRRARDDRAALARDVDRGAERLAAELDLMESEIAESLPAEKAQRWRGFFARMRSNFLVAPPASESNSSFVPPAPSSRKLM